MNNWSWLDNDQSLKQELLGELDGGMRDLYQRLSGLELSFPVLGLLLASPDTQLSIDDIAYWVGRPRIVVERTTQELSDLGLLRSVQALDLVFYGLARDRETRRVVQSLFEWRERWHSRLARIESLVGAPDPPANNSTPALGENEGTQIGAGRQ